MLQSDYERALERGYDPCEDYSPTDAERAQSAEAYSWGRWTGLAALNPDHPRHHDAHAAALATHAATWGSPEKLGLLRVGATVGRLREVGS